MFQSPLIGASVMTKSRAYQIGQRGTVSIPSDRGFCNDSEGSTITYTQERVTVSIPSDRGFCNDPKANSVAMACEAMFQSPLIGASVMTEMSNAVTVLVVVVSIPSDRGFCND